MKACLTFVGLVLAALGAAVAATWTHLPQPLADKDWP